MTQTVCLSLLSSSICWPDHKAVLNPGVTLYFINRKSKEKPSSSGLRSRKGKFWSSEQVGEIPWSFPPLLFLCLIALHNQVILQQKSWGGGNCLSLWWSCYLQVGSAKLVIFFFCLLPSGFGCSAVTEEDGFWLEDRKVKHSGLQSTSDITEGK